MVAQELQQVSKEYRGESKIVSLVADQKFITPFSPSEAILDCSGLGS
jgi:hypothetical protein